MAHRVTFLGIRFLLVFVVLAACLSTTRVAGQNPGGTIITGPNPWIDLTAPPYNAKCDGSTDDTVPIQSALNIINAAGYGRLFVPYTGNLCVVGGYSSTINSVALNTPDSTHAQITVSSPAPSWLQAGATLAVFGSTSSSGSYCNQGLNCVWPVTGVSGSVITISVPMSSISGSPSGGTVSAGLWTTAIVDIEGQCTTRQNTANCSGFTTPSGDSPIYILNSGPAGGTLPGTNTLSVKHLNFADGDTASLTSQSALGGIYALGMNSFEVSDDAFQNFTASNVTALGAGAGITLDGGSGFIQDGYIVNNKFNSTKYPVTIRGQASANLFLGNHAVCSVITGLGTSQAIAGSIAFDLGYLWYRATGATTGGENTLLGNEVEGCIIGHIVDGQNDDNIISKAEMPGATSYSTAIIGFDVLNSSNIWVDAQTLSYCTGIHVDSNSSSVHLTNPRLGGTSYTIGTPCHTSTQPDGDTFTSGTIVADSGASTPYITVSGFTPTAPGTAYGTVNSTFLSDSLPALAFQGSSSGAVTLKAPASFSGYYWNWPSSSGGSGQVLTSGGGGSAAMSWTSPTTTVNGNACSFTSPCTVNLDQVGSPGNSATFADGNFPVSFTSAQTAANQNAVSFKEATAASGSGDNEVQVATLSGSTSVPLSISQGSLNSTPSPPALSITSTWNNSSLAPTLMSASVTNSASQSASLLLNLLAGPSGATSEFSVSQSGLVTTAGNLVPGGNILVVSGNSIRSNTVSGAMVLQSGQDNTVQTTASLLTVRGFDLNGGSGTNTRAGNTLVRGGNNQGTPGSGTSDAGSFESEAGACIATTSHCVNGLSLNVSANFQSSPTTQFGVECMTATAKTVTDCPMTGSSAAKFIGIALTSSNPIMTIYSGEAPVLIDASGATVGDYVIFPNTTAGEAHDGGTTVSTTVGATLGIIEAVSGSYTLPDGTSVTLSNSSSPYIALVMLRPF